MNVTLHNLPATADKRKKRVGRGYGSGKGGHTAGRGQKGQKSRSRLPLLFEGSKQRKSLIRRTPFLRGKLRNKPWGKKPIIINLKDLDVFTSGAVVDLPALAGQKLVDLKLAQQVGVKILGDGKLTKKLTVRLKTSRSAAKKIVRAGGKVLLETAKKSASPAKAKTGRARKK